MYDISDILESPLVLDALDKVRGIFVRHTKAEEARQMLLFALAFGRRSRENSTSYLIAGSRCGKTELLKRLLQELTGMPVLRKGVQIVQGKGKRFLYVDLMGGSTPRVLARKINFKIFNDRDSLKLGEEDGTDALIENLNTHKFDGVILDEAQNLAEEEKLSRFVLAVENQCDAPMILVGPTKLADMMGGVDAMEQRSGGFKDLPPFGFANDDQREVHSAFVAAFSNKLPFESNWFKENEDDHHMLRATFYATRGRAGRHSLLVEAAIPHAFMRENGALPKELRKEDIEAGFNRVFAGLKSMKGKNPFRSEDYNRLPQSAFKWDAKDSDE
jgi:hypothetical protein